MFEHLLHVSRRSLGIHLDVKHHAATPSRGLTVSATAEVVGTVEGRHHRLPRRGPRRARAGVGGGTHERVVVSVARFDERVQRKLRGG